MFAAAALQPGHLVGSTAALRHRRHALYRSALIQTHREHALLDMLCDLDPGRLELSRTVAAQQGSPVPGYTPADLERMIREIRTQVVIVTTMDCTHGADDRRRWHSQKRFCGGLMFHEATHHFDLMNWWLGAMPVEVMATGKREFHTPTMAKRLGLDSHHQRCRTCPETAKCTFYLNLATGGNKALYLDQKHHDGEFRDQCLFRPEIDIEDTMNVMVKYDTSAKMSYSLNAFNAWEGYKVALNGTKAGSSTPWSNKSTAAPTDASQASLTAGAHTRIISMRGTANELTVSTGEGSHGGGDRLMLDEIFPPSPQPDKSRLRRPSRSGKLVSDSRSPFPTARGSFAGGFVLGMAC